MNRATLIGRERQPGVLCLFKEEMLEPMSRVPLHYGSLWCHEWSPQADIISMGTDQCALIVDIAHERFTKIFTDKNDVFCQQFSSNVR